MILDHPDQILSINSEKIIRSGIAKYVDEVGNLWTKLATYHIKKGHFSKARYTYEESLQKIMTARDFGIIYNSFLKFEEELVHALGLAEDGEIDEDEFEM